MTDRIRDGEPKRPDILWSTFALFTSAGTLLCCALPALLVVLGLGATVASLLTVAPWLVTLSRHKAWVFSFAGVMLAASFVRLYLLAPRFAAACDLDPSGACARLRRWNVRLLWTSAAIYLAGLFVAYALGPLLELLEP